MMTHVANRYEIGQKIGSGGMGDVFRGLDQRTDSFVAIKVLKSELATKEMIARFIREGEALRQLNHPSIVTLLDAVQENAHYYLVMELVEGGALDEKLRRTPQMDVQEVLNIALDLADALARAHRLNIVHRDIKPANVLLAKDGMPRLTDFGIARVVGSEITEVGSIIGTTAYIAPEVLQGDPADARSDIWSLGVMLYEMLAGEQPFKASNPGALIFAILTEPTLDLEMLRPDVPPALIDLINRMLTKNPAERIPRMRLVGAELEALLSGDVVAHAGGSGDVGTLDLGLAASRFSTPSPVSVSAVRNNLPLQTTPFVGRETELGELEKLVRKASVRLFTILATGGMGKTRLSLELAGKLLHPTHDDTLFEHGIYFVDLVPLTSADNMVQTTAEAVGYAFHQDGREAKQQLLDYLREKNSLLIMDNFEHILAGRALVQEILQAAPQVKILVTSREKLNLSAETVFNLGGMETPEWETPAEALEYSAVKLFMQSAHRVRSDFELEAGDLTYVARICRMVQGTPLGILLAAAWLEALSPREIAEEIGRSLDFLETQMHDLPTRQRSLRAVFEYSWNLLNEDERALFAQVSIFRGGFTRDAAQQVTGANLRTLQAMINKSLLHRDSISGRYDIHELLRQYADEKLRAAVDIQLISNAHSQYYTQQVAQLAPRVKGQGQLEALSAIETDFENIRTAWNWAVKQGNSDGVQAAMEGLYRFLTLRNRFMDGDQLFRAARQVWSADGENPSLLAGQVLVRYPEKPPLAHYRLGLAIAEHYEDAFEIAFCQRLMGHWLSHTEFNQPEGIPLLEASLNGFRALGEKFCVAQVLDDLGWSLTLMNRRDEQRVLVKESLDLRREVGDKIGMANSLRNMGGASGGFVDPGELAFNYWQEAKTIAYEMNDRLGIAWNAGLQAANLLLKGDFERTQALIDEGYPHAVDINDPSVKGFIRVIQGALLALRDERYAEGKVLLEEGYPPGSTPDFRLLMAGFGTTVMACGLHDFQHLANYIGPFFKTPPFNQRNFSLPMFMPCRLLTLADRGQHAQVADLLRAYLDSTTSYTGAPFPMGWAKRWTLFTRLRADLEKSLGTEAFQAAWERGTHVSMEELSAELDVFFQEQGVA